MKKQNLHIRKRFYHALYPGIDVFSNLNTFKTHQNLSYIRCSKMNLIVQLFLIVSWSAKTGTPFHNLS